MEIKRFMDLYRKHSPRQFYEMISRGRVMELRFLKDYKGNKFANWELIRAISQEHNFDCRFNSIYVKDFDEML